MNIEYWCPTCRRVNRQELPEGLSAVHCQGCGAPLQLSVDRRDRGRLNGCLVCPGRELFLRKDFSQRLGVTIVVLGFAISCVTWYFHRVMLTYSILFATAMLDVILYLVVGNVLECYNCHSLYRGADADSDWSSFDLETQERFRQQKSRRAAAATAVRPLADGPKPFDAGDT